MDTLTSRQLGRMSIPSTCTRTVSHRDFTPKAQKQNNTQHKIFDALPQLCTDVNASIMLEYIEASVVYISNTFFNGRMSTQLTQLRDTARCCTRLTRVAIFFLLLNVDMDLKKKIYDLEVECNHKKITRFMSDLRESIVTTFLVSEHQSVLDFVDACQDGYIIA